MTDKQIITKSQMIMRIAELSANLEAKEQECERLKHDNGYEVGALEKTIDNLKADREEALKQLEFVRTLNTVQEAEIRKYSKTLTEIKEIARVGAFYWKHYKEESKRYNEILQKISECEVVDE